MSKPAMRTQATQEVWSGPAWPGSDDALSLEIAWQYAVVEVERLRRLYVEQLRAADRREHELAHLWLQFWRAERRRDELYRRVS